MAGEWWDRSNKIKATVSYIDKDSNFQVYTEYIPVDTHADLVGWAQDFWAAFLERPKILRWITRIAMGKYAYRELYGTKESIIKHGWGIWDYSCQNQDYHKDKIPT
jgi:hypothetical protein